MMVDVWFFLVCSMFAAYVVLDGYDLGAGIVSPFVAKTDAQRRVVLHTILPFWDGNEVFLVAGGATLYLAFPRLFPAYVSGFYLPVMIVLWLLMGRGLGIEMRHKLDQPLWNQLWDGIFFLSSALLVLFFGAALGNLVRGVSVDAGGEFFAPLWTNFRIGDEVGILDWYTVLVGVTALAVLARHGALRIKARTSESDADERQVGERSARLAEQLLPANVVLLLAASIATFWVRPNVDSGLRAGPLALGASIVAGAIAAAGIACSAVLARRGRFAAAFYGSSIAIVGMFSCACIGMYPYGLIARVPARSVLLVDAAAAPYALGVGLAWWVPGMAAVVAYSIFAHRRLIAGAHHGAHRPSS
ncbi:MAG TPA: cytochrome d ubiquinol oxidase subunit II [Labilithrix sp.]|nr:cytochrome d ubiquinol oxidase subunit II [Labilithrix sp.]